jgi:putative endonuclease
VIASWLRRWFSPPASPIHLQRGQRGELAAREHLEAAGLRFLAANYRGGGGEIDLVFEDAQCIAFIEVKTRSAGQWLRPAAAVNRRKRRLISQAVLHYLRAIGKPRVRVRIDIVEVILTNDQVSVIRHLPNAFPLHEDRPTAFQ